jgi:hypothetical protein
VPAPELPPALGWTVLGLVFLDELLLVAAVWVAAAEAGGWVAGLGGAVLVLAAWWTCASPKAPYGGPVARPLTKALVVTAACGGLWWAGHGGVAAALLVFSVVVNGLAQLPSVAALTRPQAGQDAR